MITIRQAKPSDAAALVFIYAYYVEQTAITFEYEVPSVAEFEARITATLARYPYLVACEQEAIVGYAYAGSYKARKAYDWSAEVSVYVAHEQKGKGIGRMLYEALEVELIQQHVYQVLACITAGNQASVGFHEYLGYKSCGTFTQVGYKFDQWWDILWLQKTLLPLPQQPNDFIPYQSKGDRL